jgi:hypothetical protein
MRALWVFGVLVSLVPLVTVGAFNGLSVLGLLVVGFSAFSVLRSERLR